MKLTIQGDNLEKILSELQYIPYIARQGFSSSAKVGVAWTIEETE